MFQNGSLVRLCAVPCKMSCPAPLKAHRQSSLTEASRRALAQIPNINYDSVVNRWSTAWLPPKPEETQAAAWCGPRRLRHLVPLVARAITFEPSRAFYVSIGAAGRSGWTAFCLSSRAASTRR